ncbi:DUF975 family protein [Holzapfeliella floricola]|uniref:DUF975 family protein n=1 Tax=Holzapfeliella floricola DSM 23037 = JCM 16512 TaxID=1423744 RepID=A0A0R2DV23_9LACO|nr:DUF975 family protein [Holzapfeliella floricola]KRN04346.1 hypothetical protein FC86_GL000444 [Holzapfeliella floricola DSM 23037 = JCM 16512]
MNRIDMKHKAKALIKENRGYYFALTLVSSLLIIFQSVGTVRQVVQLIQMISREMLNNTLTIETAMRFVESDDGDVMGNLLFTTIFTLLIMSVRMVLLNHYRNNHWEKHSGIKDTFYIFSQNRWVPAIFIMILNALYLTILQTIVMLGYILIAGFIFLPLLIAANHNMIVVLIIAILLLVFSLLIFIIAIICRNFTSQLTYLLLDSYNKGDSFVSAFTKSFRLMTIKENISQYLMLQASFIGWSLLNAVTLGISGLVFSNAYIEMSYAGFYETIKTK